MTEAIDYLDLFRQRGDDIADACTRCGDCFRACPMTEPGGIAAADPERRPPLHRRFDHRRRRQRRRDPLGRDLQRQRQLHPGLQARDQPALYGPAGARLRPAQSRRQTARHPLARRVPEHEPRRAGAVAAADAAGNAGPLQAPDRAAHRAARHRLLHRLQRRQDAAYRALVPRRARQARRHLRRDGRGRPVLRRLPVPRGRFRQQQQDGQRDDRGPRLGRHLYRAVVVPVVPDLDRRGVAAELRAAVRRKAVRSQPVPDLPRRPRRYSRLDDGAPGRKARRAARAAGVSGHHGCGQES